MEKPKLLPLILNLLDKEGKAKLDFGTFRIVERKNGVITLRTNGKVKKLKPYKAIFFRMSKEFRRGIRK